MVDQQYLFEARQMQALSLAVHIPIVCFGIAFPAMFLFGTISRVGGHSRLSTLAGTVVVALSFGIVSVVAGKLTLGLVAKR